MGGLWVVEGYGRAMGVWKGMGVVTNHGMGVLEGYGRVLEGTGGNQPGRVVGGYWRVMSMGGQQPNQGGLWEGMGHGRPVNGGSWKVLEGHGRPVTHQGGYGRVLVYHGCEVTKTALGQWENEKNSTK